jgi:predicted ATPase
MSKRTFIINLIGGPGLGKTTLAALIFAELKLRGYVTEFVQEYAKQLVWTKDFDTLNNQYYVTSHQYKLLKQMDSLVDFVVTDASLISGLYYNLHNKDNTSNINKTHELILNSYKQFNNINIMLKRGNFEYETQGRLQTEEESKEIDTILRHLHRLNGIEFAEFPVDSSTESISKIVTHIIEQSGK